MINKHNLLIVVVFIAFCILTAPSSATINVSATGIGQTYIEWTWDSGLDLSNMLIDGQTMCGYETTNNTYLLTDLNPSELHTIIVVTDDDSGTNSTYTLGNSTAGAGAMPKVYPVRGVGAPVSTVIPALAVVVGIALTVWRRNTNTL